ncbi:MAG: alpha-ketoacid dehydrogenase subunit beta [Actinobacteria bacterium]|nr:alpha-ketoacid dehydrogenase subunit beta [Actinomycetota bacterium]
MREITFREAINEAYKEEMRRDKNIIAFGEDIAEHGGPFGATKGLLNEFGPERVKNTPISEVAIAGLAIGSSLVGCRPIAEFMFDDFLLIAGDQLVNQMAKLNYMSGGQYKLPITIRMPMGGRSQAAQHSQCLMAMFMSIPGLKIVCPSTPYDVKGIFKSAIRDDNPILIFEYLLLYNNKGEVPEKEYFIPIGKADVKKKGEDITIVAISQMVIKSLNVAKKMEDRGISIEVVDPISLVPLDIETIINSVKKTGKVLIAYDGTKSSGAGTEIVAKIYELAFKYLDCPIYRVAEKDCPMPFAPILESAVLPQEEDMIQIIEEMMNI